MTPDCKEHFLRISEYLDGELEEDICRKIEAHLIDCPECVECLDSLKKSIDLCKRASKESEEVPPGVRERLRSAIRDCLEKNIP